MGDGASVQAVTRNAVDRRAAWPLRVAVGLTPLQVVDARYGLPNLSESAIPGGTTGLRVRVHDDTMAARKTRRFSDVVATDLSIRSAH
jgi:hypothetical protein